MSRNNINDKVYQGASKSKLHTSFENRPRDRSVPAIRSRLDLSADGLDRF